MKTTNAFKMLLGLTGISLALASCDPANPNNPNDQEVITSLKITATGLTDTTEFAYSDPDGNGGAAPTIDTAFLSPSSSYHIQLELLDETKNPVDTITYEIAGESDVHQFFFSFTGVNLTSIYDDVDVNGKPVGLSNVWTTAANSVGSVMVTLRHQPDKNGVGVSSGDITNAGGETDIEVTFPVVIQ
jgi:hypothetical protein